MRWFQGCAFCTPPPDLVREYRDHHPWCFWKDFVKAATRAQAIGCAVAIMPFPHLGQRSTDATNVTEKKA